MVDYRSETEDLNAARFFPPPSLCFSRVKKAFQEMSLNFQASHKNSLHIEPLDASRFLCYSAAGWWVGGCVSAAHFLNEQLWSLRAWGNHHAIPNRGHPPSFTMLCCLTAQTCVYQWQGQKGTGREDLSPGLSLFHKGPNPSLHTPGL